VKNRIRNLVVESRLIDHLPYGSIREIAQKLNKERGTIRGALQGKWVNQEVIESSLVLIEDEINRLSNFLEDFESQYAQIKKEC